MLTYGVVLLNYNTRSHTAGRTRVLMEHFNWELFDHRPFSSVLALSDYHQFAYLQKWQVHSALVILSWWCRNVAELAGCSLTQAYRTYCWIKVPQFQR
jgi:hypothetical protein